MKSEIKQILEEVVRKPGLADRLADSANIIEDVGLDSLEMMEFMLEVERRLEIELDFEELKFEYLESIERFGAFLEQAKARASAKAE